MRPAIDLSRAGKSDVAAFNASCFCLPLNRPALDAAIIAETAIPNMAGLLMGRPNLFAGTGVFLAREDLNAMLDQIHAIEAAAELPAFQCAAFSRADCAVVNLQPATRGAFMGYDFHITPDGPRLIEINTNAGGAFLVRALGQAVTRSGAPGFVPFAPGRFEDRIYEMMLSEWRRAGRSGSPKTLAIVDEAPADQYLYPDMLLGQATLNRAGIETIIVNAGDLTLGSRGLMADGRIVDMVYNRLTDFALTAPGSETLRAAFLRDQVVVTPAPRHHALFADKRNLAFLSNNAQVRAWGLAPHHADTLAQLPETVIVTPGNADFLWAERKRYFFKPAGGFGGCAAYRGDKLTRRVWNDILGAQYIAQSFVPPPVRQVSTDAGPAQLKFDIRVYTYAGDPLLLAARVYQGQTTNFRTPGGGFAPVVVTDV